uniref:Uncharacterized protein n=1 Tax=Anopheles maculatus TaxID=74869 RepID=A0A182SXL6_9DIPT
MVPPVRELRSRTGSVDDRARLGTSVEPKVLLNRASMGTRMAPVQESRSEPSEMAQLTKVIEGLQQELACMRLQLQELSERARQERQEARSDLIAPRSQPQHQQQRLAASQPLPQRQQGVQGAPNTASAASEPQGRQPKTRLDAIEITPGQGQTWSDMYRTVRTAPELAHLSSVLGIGRRTTRSRLVMELPAEANSSEIFGSVKDLCDKMVPAISCRLITNQVEVRVNDIDPLALASEVAEALTVLAEDSVSAEAVRLRETWNGKLAARVRVSEKAAKKMVGLRVKINLGRSRAAQDIMLQTARELGVHVVLVSELFRAPRDNPRWVVDEHQTVAIVATGSYPIQHLWGSGTPGLVVATIAGIVFAS